MESYIDILLLFSCVHVCLVVEKEERNNLLDSLYASLNDKSHSK